MVIQYKLQDQFPRFNWGCTFNRLDARSLDFSKTTATAILTSFTSQCVGAATPLVRVDDILKLTGNGVVCRLAYLQLFDEEVKDERMCISLSKCYQKLAEQGLFSPAATNSSCSMGILDYQFTDPLLKYYLAAVHLFDQPVVAFNFFTTQLLNLNKSCWCVLEFYFGLMEKESFTADTNTLREILNYLLQRINTSRVIQDTELDGQIFLLVLGCVFEAPHLELWRYVEESLQVITFCYPAAVVQCNREILSYFLTNSSLEYDMYSHQSSYGGLISKFKTVPLPKKEMGACCACDAYNDPDTILVTSLNNQCLRLLLAKGVHQLCRSCRQFSKECVLPSQPQICADTSRSMQLCSAFVQPSRFQHSSVKSANEISTCETHRISNAALVNISQVSHFPFSPPELAITYHSCSPCFPPKELVTLAPRSTDPLNIATELVVPYSQPFVFDKKTTELVSCASRMPDACRPSVASPDRFVSSDPSPKAPADDFVFTTCVCRQEGMQYNV